MSSLPDLRFRRAPARAVPAVTRRRAAGAGVAAVLAAGFVIAAAALAAPAPRPTVDRFDEEAALGWLKRQVELGPRPAGSAASRKLATMLRAALPAGRFQAVPGGLRNVVGVVPGRSSERVIVGAHYDTVAIPGFVGANDGASGTAVVVQLAQTIAPRSLEPTVVFALFDGEEALPGTSFLDTGLRGSRVAARSLVPARAMILLDMVGDRSLSIPRESGSDSRLWAGLRAAARRVGVAPVFPPAVAGMILDDHLPFSEAGVPAIDLIDFDFPCWHELCDDLSAVSARSLDAVGETVLELLRRYSWPRSSRE
jgi:glutaminyl-peptide cyclotransferase